MTIVNPTEMLNKAVSEHYALGAFNINNLEWTQAILRAAQAKQAPIMLAASVGAIKYMGGTKVVANLVKNLDEAMGITVPVALHLDHGDFETALAAIHDGFTSIMYDGSALDFAENLENTQKLVPAAHWNDITLEAEIGSIGGEEDGIIGMGEIADVDQTKEMAALGVDLLAAGIGNVHGRYPENWQGLSLDHLKELGDATGHKLPFVLHGGSGVPDDQIKEAIRLGVAKVNVNSEAQWAFHEALRKFILSDEDLKGKNYDPRKLLKPGIDAIQDAIEERIDVFGSANKA